MILFGPFFKAQSTQFHKSYRFRTVILLIPVAAIAHDPVLSDMCDGGRVEFGIGPTGLIQLALK